MQTVLVKVSIVVKRHNGHRKSHKEKRVIGADSQFQGFSHYYHGGKLGSVQADIVLEKDQRLLHVDRKALGNNCHAQHG